MSSTTTHPSVTSTYDTLAVEQKWQALWRERDVHAVPEAKAGVADAYVFVTPPFTSGDAHMGHVRSYTIGDACSRYRRARGEAVLFSLGFDAFGLPSEIGAIEHSMTPADWVAQCVERMRAQFDSLGLSFDWSRTFVSSDPQIYRWSQWLFLELLGAGLVYQREGQVEWCETCQTVLANLQVEDGGCWRCHEPVQLVHRTQWYLRRSAYNEENDRKLEELNRWNRSAVAAQQAVLGRVDGVELAAHGFDGSELTVFTPFADAISEAACVLLSPNHPDIDAWASDPDVSAQLAAIRSDGLQREDRKAGRMPVVDTGRAVQVATVPAPLPVLISPSVDSRFGPTAILGIPSVDDVDRAIVEATVMPKSLAWRSGKDRLSAQPAARYRAADFSISRQRSWGAPIPVVNCAACGAVPVPRSELPVRLPDDLVFGDAKSTLESHPTFKSCVCPKCGAQAQRETDTLDCHIDAAWSEIPQTVPAADRDADLFENPEVRRWLPVVQLVQGADNGAFALNMRLGAKALRDAGVLPWLPSGEPFSGALMHEMVQLDGRKMSKHLGNVIAPQQLVGEVGADAVRFAVLHAAAPTKSFSWNDHALRYAARFLAELWDFAVTHLEGAHERPRAENGAIDRNCARLRFWCDTALAKVTDNLETLQVHQATRNIVRLFERIKDFEAKERARGDGPSAASEAEVAHALALLTRLLSPIAPHLAEELWELSGAPGLLCQAPWPVAEAGEPR